jgi:hypothetical protein
MLDKLVAELAVYGFTAALAICLSHGKHEKSEIEELEAHDLVVNTALTPETIAVIEDATGRNLRDQVTVDEFADINERRALLQMGDRRN